MNCIKINLSHFTQEKLQLEWSDELHSSVQCNRTRTTLLLQQTLETKIELQALASRYDEKLINI